MALTQVSQLFIPVPNPTEKLSRVTVLLQNFTRRCPTSLSSNSSDLLLQNWSLLRPAPQMTRFINFTWLSQPYSRIKGINGSTVIPEQVNDIHGNPLPAYSNEIANPYTSVEEHVNDRVTGSAHDSKTSQGSGNSVHPAFPCYDEILRVFAVGPYHGRARPIIDISSAARYHHATDQTVITYLKTALREWCKSMGQDFYPHWLANSPSVQVTKTQPPTSFKKMLGSQQGDPRILGNDLEAADFTNLADIDFSSTTFSDRQAMKNSYFYNIVREIIEAYGKVTWNANTPELVAIALDYYHELYPDPKMKINATVDYDARSRDNIMIVPCVAEWDASQKQYISMLDRLPLSHSSAIYAFLDAPGSSEDIDDQPPLVEQDAIIKTESPHLAKARSADPLSKVRQKKLTDTVEVKNEIKVEAGRHDDMSMIELVSGSKPELQIHPGHPNCHSDYWKSAHSRLLEPSRSIGVQSHAENPGICGKVIPVPEDMPEFLFDSHQILMQAAPHPSYPDHKLESWEDCEQPSHHIIEDAPEDENNLDRFEATCYGDQMSLPGHFQYACPESFSRSDSQLQYHTSNINPIFLDDDYQSIDLTRSNMHSGQESNMGISHDVNQQAGIKLSQDFNQENYYDQGSERTYSKVSNGSRSLNPNHATHRRFNQSAQSSYQNEIDLEMSEVLSWSTEDLSRDALGGPNASLTSVSSFSSDSERKIIGESYRIR